MATTSKGKFDAHEMVTERMIALLESGVTPWARPWATVTGCAWSRSTGKPYSLVNQCLLADPDKEYKTIEELLADVAGEWLTFKQAQELGGTVRKGEHGRKVVFFKMLDKRHITETASEDDEQQTKPEQFPYLTAHTVFRVDQCEGITQKYHADEVCNDIPEDLTAEDVAADYIRRSGITCNHVRGNRAYYAPALDLVVVPERSQFATMPDYYATLFHELTHSTGHESRLNRLNEKAAFGDEVYSTEELVAEIGSASILATLGLETSDTFRNSAAYMANWCKALRDDKKMFVVAAARAEKALRLILDVQ